MKKSMIIFIILFAILIVGGVLLYFLYEKPQQQKVDEFVNLSIFAKEGKSLIKTGYKLYVNGVLFLEGNTSKLSATLEKIPKNSTALIFNENLEGQNYYIHSFDFETYNSSGTMRINLNLEKSGELIITQDGAFGVDSLVVLDITSKGIFKDWVFCFDWGTHFIDIKALNYTNAERVESNVKCFEGVELENNEEIDIHLDYKILGQLDDEDYVNVSFYWAVEKPFEEEKEFVLKQYFEI